MEAAQDDREQQREEGGRGEVGEEEDEEEEEKVEDSEVLGSPSFPSGRVKKIVKLDRDISKVNSEALLLISLSAELFLASLTSGSRAAVLHKKRRIIKPEHIRSAVRAHRPSSDFLLDCLPKPAPLPPKVATGASKTRSAGEKALPPGARRIDEFFQKPSAV